MRPSSKLSVCLVAIGLGLVLLFSNSVWSDEAENPKAHVKELQQKRLQVLEEIHELAKKLVQSGRVEITEVLVAERQLLAARLEFAETKQARINACDEAIKSAEELESLAQAKQLNARGSALAVLQARDYGLEAEIAREKAAAAK